MGQDEAVAVVSRALRRARAGLRNLSRPMAAFMCLENAMRRVHMQKDLLCKDNIAYIIAIYLDFIYEKRRAQYI